MGSTLTTTTTTTAKGTNVGGTPKVKKSQKKQMISTLPTAHSDIQASSHLAPPKASTIPIVPPVLATNESNPFHQTANHPSEPVPQQIHTLDESSGSSSESGSSSSSDSSDSDSETEPLPLHSVPSGGSFPSSGGGVNVVTGPSGGMSMSSQQPPSRGIQRAIYITVTHTCGES